MTLLSVYQCNKKNLKIYHSYYYFIFFYFHHVCFKSQENKRVPGRQTLGKRKTNSRREVVLYCQAKMYNSTLVGLNSYKIQDERDANKEEM